MSDITSAPSNDDTPGAAPPAAVPLVVGAAAGAAGLAGWLLVAGGGATASAAVGLMAGLAAWLAADAAVAWPGRAAPVAAPADGAIARWRGQFRAWLSYRFIAAGLAALCGAVAAYVQLTPDRVRAESALALGAPVLLGLLVAVFGAVVTLNRASAWESRLARWTAKPNVPATPETPKEGETPKGDEKAKGGEKPKEGEVPVATSPVVPPLAPPPPPPVVLSPPPAPPPTNEGETKPSNQWRPVLGSDPTGGDEPPPGA